MRGITKRLGKDWIEVMLASFVITMMVGMSLIMLLWCITNG